MIKISSISQLDNKLCYAIIQDELMVGVFSEKDSTMNSYCSKLIKLQIDEDVTEFGEILWIAKRH